jgi:1,4-dihydroxy-2-naphthoyl-CoA hydrolase
MSDDAAEPKLTWSRAMGTKFLTRTRDEVVAEIEIGDIHRQGFGIIHGGVHCGLIETAASVGAYLVARERGQSVVGIENHTSFIRAAESGTIRVTATPITRGRRTQVWEGTVRDEQGRVLATGRVRLLCIDEPAPSSRPPGPEK